MSTELVCTQAEARDLTDQIRSTLAFAHTLIIRAYKGRVWEALDYASWDAYCSEEFEGSRMVRLPREQRREIVTEMRAEGMSTRAIASGIGESKSTVDRDIDEVSQLGQLPPVTSVNGKTGYVREPVPEEDEEVIDGEIVDDDTASDFSWKRVAQEADTPAARAERTHKLIDDAFALIEGNIKYLAELDQEVVDANTRTRKTKWWQRAAKARDHLDEIAKLMGGA